jgi:AraC family transcriptional regulator
MSLEPLVGCGRLQATQGQGGPSRPIVWNDGRLLFDQRRWACRDAEVRWTANHHLVILTEAGETDETLVRFNGRVVYTGRDRPGALTFVPAGTEREGFYRDANLVYSALWIDTGLHESLPTARGSLLEEGFANGSDEVIAPLISSIGRELSDGRVPDSAYLEHVAAVILLRLAARSKSAPEPVRGGRLNARTLRRIEEFIEANLDKDISLRDLTDVAGLPLDAFSRRFKASTGRTPYAYVLERRIIRAETLLAGCDLSLGGIALSLGFSSQSHFTSTFRRIRGMTPRAWRLQFCPES